MTTSVLTAGGVPVTVEIRDRVGPCLLLHGGAGAASVAAFGDLLAERRRTRVITPTHPGFSGTPRPDDLRTIADLAKLYATLLDELDATDVTVIGNSVGGWIAAELALLGTPRVSAVVLVDAVGLDVPGAPVADVAGLAPEQIRALSFHEPSRFPAGGPRPGDLAALYAYGGGSMSDPALAARLAGLTVPAHVIWGESDGIVTPEYGRAYAAAIPGARFTLLPRAGHLPQIETPEQLLDAI